MGDTEYCYPPEYCILKNKFGIRDEDELDLIERRFAMERTEHGLPTGDFDLNHLKSIHHHLFQDIYEWAGKTRTLEISKGGSQFMPRQFIETGMNDIHSRIVGANYLQNTSKEEFAHQAGELIGDLNHVHPFREGNGRTQMQFLEQLATKAGHAIDLTQIEKEAWIDASIRSHDADYSGMQKCVSGALQSNNDQSQDTERPQGDQAELAKSLARVKDRVQQRGRSKDQELE